MCHHVREPGEGSSHQGFVTIVRLCMMRPVSRHQQMSLLVVQLEMVSSVHLAEGITDSEQLVATTSILC